MSEKIEPEHSENVDFSPVPAGMMEMISSADVKKAEKPGFAQKMLGRFAIKTAEEWAEEDELDAQEIEEILAAEVAEEDGDSGDEEALELAFAGEREQVLAAIGEALSDEEREGALETFEVSALMTARGPERSENDYWNLVDDTARMHGLLPDVLLTVVRKDVKEKMYADERRETTAFALTVSEGDFERMVAEGKLERDEDEQNPLKSNLQFTEYQSGQEEGAKLDALKAGEVRLFFDGDVVDEESFDCLLEKSTVDEVRLDKCRGVVIEGAPEEVKKWQEILDKKGIVLPVWDSASVEGAMSLEVLRDAKMQAEERLAQRRGEQELARQASERIDETEVTKTAEKYANRLSDETMDGLFLAYQRSATPEEFRKAEDVAHEALCAAWGITEKPELRYVEDEERPTVEWSYDEQAKKPIVEINERRRTMGDASESIELIAQGDFRELQQELVERMKEGTGEISEQEAQRAKLYQWNFEHAKQGVAERDAEEVGEKCRDKLYEGLERKYAEVQKAKRPFAWIRKKDEPKAESGLAA